MVIKIQFFYTTVVNSHYTALMNMKQWAYLSKNCRLLHLIFTLKRMIYICYSYVLHTIVCLFAGGNGINNEVVKTQHVGWWLWEVINYTTQYSIHVQFEALMAKHQQSNI